MRAENVTKIDVSITVFHIVVRGISITTKGNVTVLLTESIFRLSQSRPNQGNLGKFGAADVR
jgi:hypothetical protein